MAPSHVIICLILCIVVGVALLAFYGNGGRSRSRFDDFEPSLGMTIDEVRAVLGKPDFQYYYSDSGDFVPGERFEGRAQLGYGDYRSPPPASLRTFQLLLRFESWRVVDEAGNLIEDHPMQLDSWGRDVNN